MNICHVFPVGICIVPNWIEYVFNVFTLNQSVSGTANWSNIQRFISIHVGIKAIIYYDEVLFGVMEYMSSYILENHAVHDDLSII